MLDPLYNLLSCPRCGAPNQLICRENLKCVNCNTHFFELDGLPCFFPYGQEQRVLWNHLLATFIAEGEQATKSLLEQLNRPALSPLTRKRLETALNIHSTGHTHMVNLLQEAGLRPEACAKYNNYSTKGFSKYYDLILRDWSWDRSNVPALSGLDGLGDENQVAFHNILTTMAPALNSKDQPLRPTRVLVIGAGAGRLSWDLHCFFKPSLTVAMDFNPLLSYISKRLVRDQKTIDWYEKAHFPHDEMPGLHRWQLQCPLEEEKLHKTWYPLLADAWSIPFSAQSFDLVVTPWFMDITGKDCKELIALVEKMLSPGGYWLNYGPFLYNENLPEYTKYTNAELKELFNLSHFEVLNDEFFQVPYSFSPVNKNGRIEQVWCALARSSLTRDHLKDAGTIQGTVPSKELPPWLIMPHLPVPRLTQPDLLPKELDDIKSLIDGKRSINEIGQCIAVHLPEGYDAQDVIYRIFSDYLIKQGNENEEIA